MSHEFLDFVEDILDAMDKAEVLTEILGITNRTVRPNAFCTLCLRIPQFSRRQVLQEPGPHRRCALFPEPLG
jgi:hypothetical protein